MNLFDATATRDTASDYPEYVDGMTLLTKLAEYGTIPENERPPIAIDTETEHYHWFKDHVNAFALQVSWGRENTYYLRINPPEQYGDMDVRPTYVLDCIWDLAKTILFHNAKFDLHVIKKIYDRFKDTVEFPQAKIHDTMILSHVLDENRHHGLKELCTDFGISYDEGVNADYLKDQIHGWIASYNENNEAEATYADVPDYLMVPYAVQDAYLTWALFVDKFAPQFKDRVADPDVPHLWSIYKLEMQLLWVLFRAEERGVAVDLDFVYQQIATYTPQVEQLRVECENIAQRVDFNPGSTEDVIQAFKDLGIYDRQKMTNPATGKPNLPEFILEQVDHPLAGKVLEYRLATKLLGSYFQAIVDFHKMDEDENAIVRCSFRQIGARTGRMSVTEPALQTLPKEKGNVRGAFIARPGHKLIFSDYASQELRILAHYTHQRDQSIAQIFVENRDLHSEAAMAFFGKSSPDEVSIEERKKAKGVNFAICYGAGEKKLAEILGKDYDDPTEKAAAKALLNNYHNRFPGIKWLKYAASDALEKGCGYVTTAFGRRHRVQWYTNEDGSPKMKFGRPSSNAYKAVNSLIQGTAADLAKAAMVKLDHAFREANMESIILLQVHDEIIVEAPDHEVEQAKVLIEKCMCDFDDVLVVPMEVEMAVADRWSDAVG